MGDLKYIVFRVYSKEERPDLTTQSIYFGWSDHKSVIKGFMEQRSQKKYRVVKMLDEEFDRYREYNDYNVTWGETITKIDILKLKSAQTHEECIFFTTPEELRKAEMDIQGLFSDLASVSSIDGDSKYLNMFYNLDNDYRDILEFLGYRPPEMKALFDDNNIDNYYEYNTENIESCIDDAYGDIVNLGDDFSIRHINKLPGQFYMNDVSRNIIYSLESFVKVLKDDL